MNARQRRGWAWYAAVWVPIAFFYAIALMQQQSMPASYRAALPLGRAIIAGLNYVLPVAVLGVFVWRLSGILAWPPRRVVPFVAIHTATAITFSLLWLGIQISMIAAQTSAQFALELSRAFRGFQAIDGVFVYGLIAAGSYVIR